MTNFVGPVNTGVYSGRALRLLNSVGFAGVTAARPLGSMSGVAPGTPTSTVTVASSTWTCQPHKGLLDVATSGLAGPYLYAIDVAVTGAVTAAHATLTRVDSLYVQVNDNVEDTSGAENVVVTLATGTPGGAAGVVPTRSMLLASLSRASAAAGGAVTVTWAAPKIAAAGGVIPVENATVRDAITWGTPLNPAWVYQADTDMLMRSIGAGWDHVAGGTPARVTASFPASSFFVNTTFAQFTSATYSFVPARSGLATVRCLLDVSSGGAGFGSFGVRPVIGGAISTVRTMFEGVPRLDMEILCDPVRVRAGVAVSLTLDVVVYASPGAKINGGSWTVSTV